MWIHFPDNLFLLPRVLCVQRALFPVLCRATLYGHVAGGGGKGEGNNEEVNRQYAKPNTLPTIFCVRDIQKIDLQVSWNKTS